MKHIKELEATCEGVLRVPEETFNMRSWRCRTSACFIGWLPVFAPKTGLRFVKVYTWTGRALVPKFGGETNLYAIAKYFDIRVPDAFELFRAYESPSRNTAKAVVKRVRAYIKKHGGKREKAK